MAQEKASTKKEDKGKQENCTLSLAPDLRRQQSAAVKMHTDQSKL